MPFLTDMAAWSHQFAAEVLHPGDLAVDLTAGRGHDCLHLAGCVVSNTQGTVLAFDVQPEAIESSRQKLLENGINVAVITRPQQIDGPGVFLVQASHERLSLFTPHAPKVIIGNLGYLPGGDHAVATQADSSLATMQQAFEELQPGGRLILVVYTGHDQGREESDAICNALRQLHPRDWHIIKMEPFICREAPYLLVAEKRGKKRSRRDLLRRD